MNQPNNALIRPRCAQVDRARRCKMSAVKCLGLDPDAMRYMRLALWNCVDPCADPYPELPVNWHARERETAPVLCQPCSCVRPTAEQVNPPPEPAESHWAKIVRGRVVRLATFGLTLELMRMPRTNDGLDASDVHATLTALADQAYSNGLVDDTDIANYVKNALGARFALGVKP